MKALSANYKEAHDAYLVARARKYALKAAIKEQKGMLQKERAHQGSLQGAFQGTLCSGPVGEGSPVPASAIHRESATGMLLGPEANGSAPSGAAAATVSAAAAAAAVLHEPPHEASAEMAAEFCKSLSPIFKDAIPGPPPMAANGAPPQPRPFAATDAVMGEASQHWTPEQLPGPPSGFPSGLASGLASGFASGLPPPPLQSARPGTAPRESTPVTAVVPDPKTPASAAGSLRLDVSPSPASGSAGGQPGKAHQPVQWPLVAGEQMETTGSGVMAPGAELGSDGAAETASTMAGEGAAGGVSKIDTAAGTRARPASSGPGKASSGGSKGGKKPVDRVVFKPPSASSTGVDPLALSLDDIIAKTKPAAKGVKPKPGPKQKLVPRTKRVPGQGPPPGAGAGYKTQAYKRPYEPVAKRPCYPPGDIPLRDILSREIPPRDLSREGSAGRFPERRFQPPPGAARGISPDDRAAPRGNRPVGRISVTVKNQRALRPDLHAPAAGGYDRAEFAERDRSPLLLRPSSSPRQPPPHVYYRDRSPSPMRSGGGPGPQLVYVQRRPEPAYQAYDHAEPYDRREAYEVCIKPVF